MPLWPPFSASGAANALLRPAPPIMGNHLLGARLTAPNLNSCSSIAAVPASAWSKDHWSSAGKTTLFVCVVQVTRTATLSSKAHFWSDNNLDPAVIWFGSLKVQDLPPSCTAWQILTHLKSGKSAPTYMASGKNVHIFIIIFMSFYTDKKNRNNSPFSEPCCGQGTVRTLNNPSGLYE